MLRTTTVGLVFLGMVPLSYAQVSLDTELEPYLRSHELPALAVAVYQEGNLLAIGAVGSRKAGANLPITRDDRFHIGSNTKAMTATLIAIHVQEGKLKWDTTVGEIFPELVEKMAPGVAKITLTQLLSHTSGFPSDNEKFVALMNEAMNQEGNLDRIRYWLVKHWIEQPLVSKSGTEFAYSNMGYTLAGAMLERITERTWDELITERIFRPLDLKSAGLGCQASLGTVDATLGHTIDDDNKIVVHLPGPNGDNPSVIGPAGIAHMSVLDFGRWASWNAGMGKRGPKLVRPEMLVKLHTPVFDIRPKKSAPGTPSKGKYALGWGVVELDWTPYPLLFHAGSNQLNLAHIWVDPKRDFTIVLMTNIGGTKGHDAFMKLAPSIYARFTKPNE